MFNSSFFWRHVKTKNVYIHSFRSIMADLYNERLTSAEGRGKEPPCWCSSLATWNLLWLARTLIICIEQTIIYINLIPLAPDGIKTLVVLDLRILLRHVKALYKRVKYKFSACLYFQLYQIRPHFGKRHKFLSRNKRVALSWSFPKCSCSAS